MANRNLAPRLQRPGVYRLPPRSDPGPRRQPRRRGAALFDQRASRGPCSGYLRRPALPGQLPGPPGGVRHQRHRGYHALYPVRLRRGAERQPTGGPAAGVQRAAVHRLPPRPDPGARRRPIRRGTALPGPWASRGPRLGQLRPRSLPGQQPRRRGCLRQQQLRRHGALHPVRLRRGPERRSAPGPAAPVRRAAVHRLPPRPDPGARPRPIRRGTALPGPWAGRGPPSTIPSMSSAIWTTTPTWKRALGTGSTVPPPRTTSSSASPRVGPTTRRPGFRLGSMGCSTSPPTPT